jgi:hypothetical protein
VLDRGAGQRQDRRRGKPWRTRAPCELYRPLDRGQSRESSTPVTPGAYDGLQKLDEGSSWFPLTGPQIPQQETLSSHYIPFQIARFSNISLRIENAGQDAPQCGPRTGGVNHETDREIADRCHVVRRSRSDHVVGGRGVANTDVLPGALQVRTRVECRSEAGLAVAKLAS